MIAVWKSEHIPSKEKCFLLFYHILILFSSNKLTERKKERKLMVQLTLLVVRETGRLNKLCTDGVLGLAFSEVQSLFRERGSRRVLRRFTCIKQNRRPVGHLFCLVRETGLEPVRRNPHAPQTCASASSATLAFDESYYTRYDAICQPLFEKFSESFAIAFNWKRGGYLLPLIILYRWRIIYK